MTERPRKADVFRDIAEQFARLSTCERGQVGAVIVRDSRIISTGYNGAPAGMPHCTEVGCLLVEVPPIPNQKPYAVPTGCQRSIHAEANALMYAARYGVSVNGASMFCTHGPCLACAQLMIAAGIAHVLYDVPYRLTDGVDLLERAGVKLWPTKKAIRR